MAVGWTGSDRGSARAVTQQWEGRFGRIRPIAEKVKMGNLLPNNANSAGQARPGEPAGLAFVEGVSASMRPVEAVIRELAQSDVPVLVLAEAGAGKHATAQRIHQMSRRSGQPFRWFQCLGLEPADLEVLREQEDQSPQPNAGTVYLEELADMSQECQICLLDVLPQSPGNGVGNQRARLICGSARDLEVEVKRGRLREDLYYRISGVCLRLPPLRQRKDDIPFLMGYFLRKYARDFRRTVPRLERGDAALVPGLFLAGKLAGIGRCGAGAGGVGRREVALGGLRALLRKPDSRRQRAEVSLKAASRGGFARSREGIDFERADAHALEPAAGRAGITDQLQGLALQVEANWI